MTSYIPCEEAYEWLTAGIKSQRLKCCALLHTTCPTFALCLKSCISNLEFKLKLTKHH